MPYRLNDGPNAWGCYEPQCMDSTWDHECPTVPDSVAPPPPPPSDVEVAHLTALLPGQASDG